MKYSVLIVEDEEIERESLITLIQTRYQQRLVICALAQTGEEALLRAKALQPHLILMDIQIPKGDGLWVAEQLREAQCSSEIVFVTAFSRFEYAQRALRLGAVDYLVKPYSLKTFDVILNKSISRLDDLGFGGSPSEELEGMDNPSVLLVEKAKSYIDEHFIEDLKLEDIADYCNVSKYHLSRLFRFHKGMGVKEYLIHCRIVQAQKLLQQGRTVSDAAFASGFSDANYFSRIVRKYTGRTATDLRSKKV
jgi:YesN/AraC family two-component response regulator